MGTFASLAKRIDVAIADLPNMIDRAVLENRSEMIDLNTAQLSQGKNSLGELLERYATDSYAQYKKAIGSQAPDGVPNLYLEGDFYEGFYIEKDGDDYIMYSKDGKAGELGAKYGFDIFGLSEASLAEVLPNILEDFLTDLRKTLRL